MHAYIRTDRQYIYIYIDGFIYLCIYIHICINVCVPYIYIYIYIHVNVPVSTSNLRTSVCLSIVDPTSSGNFNMETDELKLFVWAARFRQNTCLVGMAPFLPKDDAACSRCVFSFEMIKVLFDRALFHTTLSY